MTDVAAAIDNIGAPPTSEIGTSLTLPNAGLRVGGASSWLLDDSSNVSALLFPTSIDTFEKMRRDAQISTMWNGFTIPIRRYPWMIDPNGAEDIVVQKFADQFALPIKGAPDDAPVGRSRNRFNHDDHLYHVLLSMIYGMMYFEQFGEILDDPDTPSGFGWHLQKLSPRMPKTISRIEVEDDGGLKAIRQWAAKRGQLEPPPIPVSQLVAYVWQKEGANWYGRSLLIPLYKNWLIKDRLLRVDAVKHERTGAGVPIAEAPPGASAGEIQALDKMAQRYKVGEAAGGAIPAGTKFRLVGVEGATSDVLASIRYHDEVMAGGFFSEVKTLGQSAYGSRALGETFATLMNMAQEAVANWYARITNEHVIEDWVDWNFGGDYGAPRIIYTDGKNGEVIPGVAQSTDKTTLEAQKALRSTVDVQAAADAYRVEHGKDAEGDFFVQYGMAISTDELAAMRRVRAQAIEIIEKSPDMAARLSLPRLLAA